ncbi:MAG: RNA-binding protein [Desulfuromonadales bacterium]|nr:RNA-binding protein [Desulfuromonadales bacterium]
MKEKSTAKNLYVANLPFEVEEEELRKLFALCGTVRSIHMVTDPQSGHFKGCAFVQMSDAAEARDAIVTLDGLALHKRMIRVSAALPKKKAAPAGKAGESNKPRAKRPGAGRR